MDDDAIKRAIQELLDAIDSGRPELEIDALIENLEALSPMPEVSDLIFIHGMNSPDDILERIRAYRPIAL